ncbi:MAG TPA: fatty acid desaturase CarF family protein [Pyrinomonadaceae bacterium]|nr:fatty acid desaturase CarF family protein [Pyrinomonadaceae bacterium]
MKVFTLPTSSRAAVALCLAGQALALQAVARHGGRSLWLAPAAFFAGGFIADLVSGLFHFSFDYVWPPRFPVMGPISVEFQEHHTEPALDPSAWVSNLTRGAYAALPFALLTWGATAAWPGTAAAFLGAATLMSASVWMLGFHQLHSYTHMGSSIPAEEFNRTVAEISRLESKRRQEEEFVKLFDAVGIPPFVRLLQRCRLSLRPELHWRHHIYYESDFSSVNGWSDPLMNLLYRPLARRKKAKQTHKLAANPMLRAGHSR